jgi:hypothetical protein
LVWSNSQVKDSEGDTPWYEWRVNPQPADSEPWQPLQVLFAILVHDLTARGVLDCSEGDQLLADVGWTE